MTPAADTAPIGGAPASTASGSWLRPKVVIPVLAVLLLLVAVAFVAGRFRGEDVMSAKQHDSTTETTSRAATTTTATPTTTSVTTTSTTTPTATSTVAAQTAAVPVVVGARCSDPGATGTTPEGTTVYCTQLQYTNRYLWSAHQDLIPNPVLTTSPATLPPMEDESPVRICMQETGHTRLRCAAEILRGNGG